LQENVKSEVKGELKVKGPVQNNF